MEIKRIEVLFRDANTLVADVGTSEFIRRLLARLWSKVGKMAGKSVWSTGWRLAVRRWAHEKSYYPQLGLLHDDCLVEDEFVKEALRRIPEQERNARSFRIIRAIQLSNQKTILPKEEWTKLEDERPYLRNVLGQVKEEHKERKMWNSL